MVCGCSTQTNIVAEDVRLNEISCVGVKTHTSTNAPTEFPVRVILNTNVLSEQDVEIFVESAERINSAMGQTIVTPVTNETGDDSAPNTVVMFTTAIHSGKAIGLTTHHTEGHSFVQVETSSTVGALMPQSFYTHEMVLEVATHEMLHALGLEHEADQGSLMASEADPSHHAISAETVCGLAQLVLTK